MRIIAVMSPKGGIGKTTTSDAIAYMLGEEQEKRVLILDGDPQGDTSKTFEAYEPEGTGMSELLERHVSVGGSYRTTDLIRPTQYSHIDIIPANGYLMQTDMKLLLKQEANQVTRLRDALEEISEAYDYCICDCGRLLDMVVINILLAAELVIAPVKVGGYENEAIHNLQEQVDDLREINPELRIKGLVTMRQKNKTSLDFEEWMKTSSGFDMFVTPIRRSIVAEKASMRMAVLPQFSKNCIVSQDYRNVVHELLKELEGYPTAIPFSARARDRVLHALVISAIRLHYPEFASNDGAAAIDKLTDEQLNEVKALIMNRLNIIKPSAKADAEHEIDDFISNWKLLATQSKELRYYVYTTKTYNRLMNTYGEVCTDLEKPTLRSMRDVERAANMFYYTED